jgi:acyl-CoA reductase-like NAD-dependent aldehyde dehydrogenase
MKVINPATGAVLNELKVDTAETVAAKVRAARVAQKAWAAKPLSERLVCIEKFKQAVIRDTEKLARVMTEEVGKPISQSRNELKGLIGRLDFFIENTPKVLAPEVVLDDPGQKLRETITLEPLGVIANISAWNYPWFVGSNVYVPALLTGNAVVYKPSEFSTLTGIEMGRLLHEAGVPKDVFSVLVGGGEIGQALLQQKIDGVFFTGSYATGKKIAELVAGRMIRVQMELGGKDPVYVADDVISGAGVKAVAEATADGAFYNNGQSCCAVERIYVHEKIHDEFVRHFVETVRGFQSGDPMGEGTYLSVLARPQQVAVLEDQIADAFARGATVATGGKARAGTIEPTVLTSVNHTMKVMREESFGPLIGIQKVSGDEQALELMNDSDYGLTAGVYCNDRARAKKLLAGVHAGSAYWNCCDRVSPRLPWSGRGHSGIGATLSTHGILAFVQTKGWHERG